MNMSPRRLGACKATAPYESHGQASRHAQDLQPPISHSLSPAFQLPVSTPMRRQGNNAPIDLSPFLFYVTRSYIIDLISY
ncbi:hypothetical protein V2G26_014213 [Clonostachys chloroleuca]